jgi:hypothetical protein
VDRRAFLALLAGAALPGCTPRALPPGALLGPDAALGHRLRAGGFPRPAESARTRVVIVGGGVSGLSAAWALQRAGVDDFLLLEAEPETGGNARAGASAVTSDPWGAHYLPLPTREATDLVAMLRDLGVVTGVARDGAPVYDERYLSAPPRERLFYLGAWQGGHEPRADRATRAEFERFAVCADALKRARGRDGRPAFATPSALSSRDPRWRALDRLGFAYWLAAEGFRDPRLLWYLDYACRDDFGSRLAGTSAWAGLHYFAGRVPFGDYPHDPVLTWPEGNAFLTRALAARAGARIVPDQLAYKIVARAGAVEVHAFDGHASRVYRAAQAILAVPQYVATRLLPGYPAVAADYAPWLVANLHVAELPGGEGAGPCWDNVLYDSPGVGYVIATHQRLAQSVGASVLTYYWPLILAAHRGAGGRGARPAARAPARALGGGDPRRPAPRPPAPRRGRHRPRRLALGPRHDPPAPRPDHRRRARARPRAPRARAPRPHRPRRHVAVRGGALLRRARRARGGGGARLKALERDAEGAETRRTQRKPDMGFTQYTLRPPRLCAVQGRTNAAGEGRAGAAVLRVPFQSVKHGRDGLAPSARGDSSFGNGRLAAMDHLPMGALPPSPKALRLGIRRLDC